MRTPLAQCESGPLALRPSAFPSSCSPSIERVMGNPDVSFCAALTLCGVRLSLPALACLPVLCTLGHHAPNAKELNSLLFIVFSYLCGRISGLFGFWGYPRNEKTSLLFAVPWFVVCSRRFRNPALWKSGIKNCPLNLYRCVSTLLPNQASPLRAACADRSP